MTSVLGTEASRRIDAMVDALCAEAITIGRRGFYGETPHLAGVRALLELPKDESAVACVALMRRWADLCDEGYARMQAGRAGTASGGLPEEDNSWIADYLLDRVITAALRARPAFSPHTLSLALRLALRGMYSNSAHGLFRADVVRALENAAFDPTSSPDLQRSAEAFAVRMQEILHPDVHRLASRVRRAAGLAPRTVLPESEAWSERLRESLGAMPPDARGAWEALLDHGALPTESAPTAKWTKAARPLLAAVGRDAFARLAGELLPLVDAPALRERRAWPGSVHLLHPGALNACSAPILRGLCWFALIADNPELARPLAACAIAGFRRLPKVGPRSVAVGNAAVLALSGMSGDGALAALALLRAKVKSRSGQIAIEKAFRAAAERRGVDRSEIEELAAPSYGMEEVGVLVETIEGWRAEVRVVGGSKTETRWVRIEANKAQKSPPKELRADHADEIKELRAAAKDIEQMLPAQRDRLERLFLDRRSWSVERWRERCLDHPLVGVHARRLVWAFGAGGDVRTAAWSGADAGATLVDSSGAPFSPGADATVRLWHPVESTREEVAAWRRFYESRGVRQPFKQAHREVYVVTPAERTTSTYSNRFAAHIVRQHQFNQLAAARRWRYQIRLMVDATYMPPSIALPAWDLLAEFWVDAVPGEHGVATNNLGTYLHLGTDQVRFYRLSQTTAATPANWTPLRVEDVPPLPFSEVMRDVDLLVGVAGIGADPHWTDSAAGRTRPDWHEHWLRVSFGELAASARIRKEVLEGIVPRLAIAPRCSFTDRHLVVRGNKRVYKIHLGSGNILMSPDDRYLCIVPDHRSDSASEKVMLPFEGDQTLSVVLAKAFMLAADDRITDPTIVSQIDAAPR